MKTVSFRNPLQIQQNARGSSGKHFTVDAWAVVIHPRCFLLTLSCQSFTPEDEDAPLGNQQFPSMSLREALSGLSKYGLVVPLFLGSIGLRTSFAAGNSRAGITGRHSGRDNAMEKN